MQQNFMNWLIQVSAKKAALIIHFMLSGIKLLKLKTDSVLESVMSSIWVTIGVARMIKYVCTSKGEYAYQRATTQPSRQNDYNMYVYQRVEYAYQRVSTQPSREFLQ